MPEGVPDFAIYVPGADSGMNGSRSQRVRAVTLHTTQGNDSRGLGSGRHHSSPGTFNFLNRDEGIYCYYPAHVRCSHAAGANHAGPGIENEGYTGRPLTPNQIAHLGQLAHWLHDTYGVPLTYRTGDPREWIDNTGFRGFIAHRAVDYPPNTSYRHTDEITPAEWAAAIGSTPTTQTKAQDMVVLCPPYQNTVLAYVVQGNKMLRQLNSEPRGAYGIPQAAIDFANSHSCPILTVTQEEWDRVVTDDANIVKRLAAWIAKLFPAKAARAGEV